MAVALIWLAIFLIGASLLMMVIFGIKNAGTVLQGSKLGLAAFALPVLLLVIMFAVYQGHPDGAWTAAGVMTAVALTLFGLLGLVVFGVKSLFT